MKTPLFISEYLWQPLVTISPDHRGFLVQPGSTMLPKRLHSGKFWHWPYLNTVRLISLDTHTYPINKQVVVGKNTLGDEPIIAATKDMRLINIEGQLEIRVDRNTPDVILATLNKHSINRLIRPLIRSGVRQAVAEFGFEQLSNVDKLTKRANQLVQEYLNEHGIEIVTLELRPIKPFNPFIPATNPQSPAGHVQPGISRK